MKDRTVSLWTVALNPPEVDRFRNAAFEPTERPLWVRCNPRVVQLWRGLFFQMNPDMVPLDEDEDEDSAPLYDGKRGAMPSVRMKGGVVGEAKFAEDLSLDEAVGGGAGGDAGEGDGGSVAAPPPILAPMRSRADTLKLPLTSEGTVWALSWEFGNIMGLGSIVC